MSFYTDEIYYTNKIKRDFFNLNDSIKMLMSPTSHHFLTVKESVLLIP
jgi:hypothetical protein